MRPIDLTDFLDHLAQISGEAILPFFRSHLAVSDKPGKGAFDPVTEADRAAELVIRRAIKEQFPSHGILGEEFGTEQGDAEFVWVIDPIDGTRSFICGLPVWGTLIGLKRNGTPALGLMHQPFTRERFFGDGARAWLRTPQGERKLVTRTITDLAEATLMTTSPHLFTGKRAEQYGRIEKGVKLTRYGTDCYAYAMVAAGQIDLVVETGLQEYDIMPLIPIIEGAGGVVTDWQGGAAVSGGDVVASANHQLHEKTLRLING